ncbi:hypothetical protein CFK37_08775 [Virgibacillus phasianinus]|uniref:Pyrimidine dimer DNA glycosylase n=1 Tax=Virgibacillus phasianinus TaxID=2017483 RepID=A0A220U2F6_9BACI|nr:TIGR02328 family protein [Virgibacillus phasianinus]ASK62247.1 hypothetical protein CFK37_08775 [Virgibacillus phasianinus]
MRLWHEDLLSRLPRQQLLGQHRECCALRGNGWGKRHATVNYVFNYSPYKLFLYHQKVMDEMKKRGYRNDPAWEDPTYRGKISDSHSNGSLGDTNVEARYPEHDDNYLQECIDNLHKKGIDI